MRFSVCVLFYGPHTELASRWLAGFERHLESGLIQDVRIGLNAPADETVELVKAAGERFRVPTHVWWADPNVWKYPLMRRMFSPDGPPLAPLTMWFDDDSWIQSTSTSWLAAVDQHMENCDMLGHVYRYTGQIRKPQWQWITQQAWYNPAVAYKPVINFLTGGWWTIRSEILQKWNWPTPDLMHNGGDYMLGELFRHQGYRMRHYTNGVCINADDTGRASTAKRRGGSTTHVGMFDASKSQHQDFTVTYANNLQALVGGDVSPIPLYPKFEL